MFLAGLVLFTMAFCIVGASSSWGSGAQGLLNRFLGGMPGLYVVLIYGYCALVLHWLLEGAAKEPDFRCARFRFFV
jgi:hypothetical protein